MHFQLVFTNINGSIQYTRFIRFKLNFVRSRVAKPYFFSSYPVIFIVVAADENRFDKQLTAYIII